MLTPIVSWIALGLNLLVLIVSVAGFIKLIKNDLTHVQTTLKEIKESTEEIKKELNQHGERLAGMEERCKAYHG